MVLALIVIMSGSIIALKFAGYEPMAVLTGSMHPIYSEGDLVLVNTKIDPEKVRIGDVITYRISGDNAITHRVVEKDPVAKSFITRGDNNNSNDTDPVTYATVVGKVQIGIPYAGQYLRALTSGNGLAVLCFLVAFFLILIIVPPIFTKKRKKRPRKRLQPVREYSAHANMGFLFWREN
jgi:signal peptidase